MQVNDAHESEHNKDHGSKISLEPDDKESHIAVETGESDEAHEQPEDEQVFQPVALCILRKNARPRRWFIRLVTWPYFERISICVILINCVTLGLFDPSDPDCVTSKCHALERVELAIYVFFAIEMLAKWIAMGLFGKLGYFADSWNRLDFFIVAAGTLELALGAGEELSSVRAIRVLRPLRAINRVPSIRILVTLLLDTLPMLGNVLAVCSLIFAIFGIVGVQMWGGQLRGRCYLDLPENVNASSFNLSPFYVPSFQEDFVCSLPTNNGMKRCTADAFDLYSSGNRSQCNETYEGLQEKSSRSNFTNACVNWNQYYNTCRLDGPNPYFGALSFDNIFIAWVAIFQVITLEGWSDIMYFIQDANGVWNWVYFIVLIVVGSYFMTNLCLVVITTQFQETKQRESELMKANLRRQATSTSTLNSSKFGKEGCWTEILKYIEHLLRMFKRRVMRRFNCNSTGKHKTATRTSRRKKSRTKKHVYHHHHHHHHHHHFHHHVSCPIANAIAVAPHSSGSEGEARSEPNPGMYNAGNTLTVPGQVPPGTPAALPSRPTRRASHDGVPAINIVTGSSCSVRPDAQAPSTNGEMVTLTKAEVSVSGQSASADVNTHSFLSAASLSSAMAASTASAAAASTIQTACACAVRHLEKDMNMDYDTELVYEEDGASESEFTDDDEARDHERRASLWWRIRRSCRTAVDSKWFMYIIMGAIFLNTVSMAVEFHEQPQQMTDVLEILNYVFTAVFAIEMLLKVVGLGPYGYIKDILNIFDALIVIMSIVELFDEGGSGISVLRSFRLLRIFKLVRFMPALQRQLLVMLHTMDNVVTFLALLALFIFTASILGMHLFGGKYAFPDEDGKMQTARANFDDLFWALVTVFQVLTQEDWNTVMYDGMRATSAWAALYFILMMTIGNYILFNLLVAILVEGFASQPENAESSANLQKEKATCDDRPLVSYPDSYQRMRNSRVCITPTPSVIYIDQVDQRALCNCSRRASLPDFHAKPSHVSSGNHRSAPTTPFSLTPTIARKMAPEEPILVLSNPQANADKAWLKKNESETEAEEGEHQDSAPVPQGNSFFARRRTWSLYLFSPNNLCRLVAERLIANKWFDRVVLFFILMNCIVMALDGPTVEEGSKKRYAIDVCMYIFLAVFTVEMAIKVIAKGFYVGATAYLRSAWNVMDCFLVVISWVDVIVDLSTDTDSSILGILRVFRALRTLRPLRVISRAPGLKIVVETLISSLKPIGNIVLIAATFFAIFGILGVQLFKGKFYYCDISTVETRQECADKGGEWLNKEYNFDNLAKALLTLFVFSTKDGWVTIMYDGIDAVDVDKQPQRNYAQWNVIYFVAFLLLAGFVVLNMLVGVVVENFQKCRDLAAKDLMREREAKRAKRLREKRDNEAAEDFPQPRRFVYRVCTHGYFDLGIAVIIALNVVCMAMEHYDQPAALGEFLKVANYFFTAVFIVEAVLKIYAIRKPYFKDRWNVLDIIIVVLSIVGIVLEEMNENLPINPTIIRVMRVLRIARVLKLLKTAEGIRKLLDTVAQALPAVGNLGLLFLLMFFIFAALGVELFGNIDCDKVQCEGLDEHAHFRDFGFAMLTLFRVSTGDNWNGILKDTINTQRCEVTPYQGCSALEHIAPIYFAIFVLATQFVLLNVVVAVLMKHLEEAREIDLEEQASQTAATDDSARDTQPSKTSLKVPAEKQRKVSFGEGRSIHSEDDRRPESEANNNAELPPKTGSESSLGSREIDKLIRPRRDSDLLRRLPPIDRSDNISLRSTGSASSYLFSGGTKTFPKQVESASVPELSGPKPQGMDRKVRQLSPRAPIYHLSEDSDWYDSVINVGNSRANFGNHVTSTDGLITSDHDNDESELSAVSRKFPPAPRTPQDATPKARSSSETASWSSPVPSEADGSRVGDVEMTTVRPQTANTDSHDHGARSVHQSYV